MKLRRRPENFAGFETLNHDFLCFLRSGMRCGGSWARHTISGTLPEGTQVLSQRNSKDPCKMTISRMAFLSRHCCSLSQQQCAAEAAANQSSRSCNTWSLRQSTKHSNKQCLCLRSPCYWQEGAFEKLKYTPRKCAHDAHPRGVLISAAVDLARRRRRNFARRHNDSCKMTYARMALWKRSPGSLIAATCLQ